MYAYPPLVLISSFQPHSLEGGVVLLLLVVYRVCRPSCMNQVGDVQEWRLRILKPPGLDKLRGQVLLRDINSSSSSNSNKDTPLVPSIYQTNCNPNTKSAHLLLLRP